MDYILILCIGYSYTKRYKVYRQSVFISVLYFDDIVSPHTPHIAAMDVLPEKIWKTLRSQSSSGTFFIEHPIFQLGFDTIFPNRSF